MIDMAMPNYILAIIITVTTAIITAVLYYKSQQSKTIHIIGNSNSFKTRSLLKLLNLPNLTQTSARPLYYQDFIIHCGSKRKSQLYKSSKKGKLIVLQRDEDFELLREVENDSRVKLFVFDSEWLMQKYKTNVKSVVRRLEDVDLLELKALI